MKVYKISVEKIIKANVRIIAVTQRNIHVKRTEKDHLAKRVQERGVSTMKIQNLVEDDQVEGTKRIINNNKSISAMTQRYPIANRVLKN